MTVVVARVRAIGWCLVGLGVVGLAIGSRQLATWSESAGGLALLAGFIALLILEAGLLGAGWIGGGRGDRAAPGTARPADGVVDVWPMVGVEADRLIEATPWRRFVRLDQPGSTRGRGGRVGRLVDPAHKPLLGDVALISVFVGRDGRSWTEHEIADAHRSLLSVGCWLEREAVRWGALVNVGLADTWFQADDHHDGAVAIDFVPEGDDFGPMEADATTKAVVGASRVAASLGFADVADLVARINPTIAADAHVWLFHLKSRGRSHAIPARDRVVAGVGLAICHARESSFPEPLLGPGRVDPTTVAHEMLHLFGASDKYGVALTSFPAGQVPRRDIMRLEENRLDRLKVGRLTALEVGWPVG